MNANEIRTLGKMIGTTILNGSIIIAGSIIMATILNALLAWAILS